MSETKTELNPCPECGGQANPQEQNYKIGAVYIVTCESFSPNKKDGCSMVGAGLTEEESIKDWNSFHSPTDEWKREYMDDPFHSRYNAMD